MSISRFVFSLAAAGILLGVASVAGAAELPKDANTTCPIMIKEEVDPDLYVDYKGERVYLCCNKCKRKFNQDPDKYLKRVKDAKAAAKPVAAAPASAAVTKTAPATR